MPSDILLAKKLVNLAHRIVAVDKKTRQTGCMVALEIPKKLGEKLAIPGGEPVRDLHITILFLGNLDKDLDEKSIPKLKNLLKVVCAQTAPLKGVLGGYGRFSGPESDVFYASSDIPGLSEFRSKLVEEINNTPGLSFKNNHGFTPHLTLKYMKDRSEPNPELRLEPVKVKFDEIILKLGTATSRFTLEGK